MDLRDTILKRIAANGVKPVTLIGKPVGKQALYDWLGNRSKSIASTAIEALLDRLGLTIVPVDELKQLRNQDAIARKVAAIIVHESAPAIANHVTTAILKDVEDKFRYIKNAPPIGMKFKQE